MVTKMHGLEKRDSLPAGPQALENGDFFFMVAQRKSLGSIPAAGDWEPAHALACYPTWAGGADSLGLFMAGRRIWALL